MKRIVWLMALAPLVATGGIFDARLDDPAKIGSAIEFGSRLQLQTTFPSGRPGPNDVAETRQEDGFTTYTGQWCLNRTGFNTAADLGKRFRLYCEAHGGALDGSVCFDKVDASRILFVAVVQNGPRCYRTPKVDMLVIEPTSQPASQAYVSTARGIYEKEQAERQAAAQARARADELQRMRKIGTRVCKEEQNVRYTGFVEQVEEPKIRISISFAKLVNDPQAQAPGFQPMTIWDQPANWVICE